MPNKAAVFAGIAKSPRDYSPGAALAAHLAGIPFLRHAFRTVQQDLRHDRRGHRRARVVLPVWPGDSVPRLNLSIAFAQEGIRHHEHFAFWHRTNFGICDVTTW
jgi:hypothetical protein